MSLTSTRYESEDGNVSLLQKELNFEFSGKQARNRFLKAAMTERLSSWDPKDAQARGIPSESLINVYKTWGEGGFGMILTGNIMIDFEQLEAAGNLIIPQTAKYEGERFDAFKKMGDMAKKHGALIVGQVSHPGRQVSEKIQSKPISASDVQLEGTVMGMTYAKPHPATDEEIHTIVQGFAHAAEYLQKTGYDGIELHGAHGYLLSQFISPSTNKRTDKYGGSLENRARIIFEIAQEIQKRVEPGFILGIKLNSVEFQDKGFQPEEAQKLCALLEEHKFDFVELSGGTYESLAFKHKKESTKKREAFFLDFAEMITPSLKKTKSYVTGGLKTLGAMTKALDICDGVGLARPVCQEFDLPENILSGKVKAAIELKLDPNDFGVTNIAAGSQIRQVGNGKDPIDLSQQDNIDLFFKEMKTWSKKMEEDTEGKKYGYVDLP